MIKIITNYRQHECLCCTLIQITQILHNFDCSRKANKETNPLQLLTQLIGDSLHQDSLIQSYSLLLCSEIINKMALEKLTFSAAVEAVSAALWWASPLRLADSYFSFHWLTIVVVISSVLQSDISLLFCDVVQLNTTIADARSHFMRPHIIVLQQLK